MSDANIALNRFGLGARAGDTPPDKPKRWLVDQFESYDARPAAIAALPSTRDIASNILAYQVELRAIRQAGKPQDAAPPPVPAISSRPAGYSPPRGDMAMVDMARDLEKEVASVTEDPAREARRRAQRQARDMLAGAITARCAVALETPAPFVERMVHFWANHFAVSADQLSDIYLSGQLEFDAIRPNVLGTFRDMLFAVERHPTMLLYLDQAQSIGPNSPAAQRAAGRGNGRRAGLNENLAREILELHTLGVRSVYTQGDVTEFARAMTGWTVVGLGRARDADGTGSPGDFRFMARYHEPGPRTLLRVQWPQTGEDQAAAILDFLASHPATARHVATKIARHFAGDDPPASLVGKLERSFLASGGDLPHLYRTLIEAPEAWTPKPVKFRTPWEWTIAAWRALGVSDLQPGPTQSLLAQLGQPVWKPGSPAGWEDVAESWEAPDAIMRRVEAAERFALRTRDTLDARVRVAELFPGAVTPGTVQAIARAESPAQGVALMLVSPEFMRR
ncbi:DUF1800 domain-containing protein [Sphingomonas sp. HF-S3]|uniref:DUF1800 domain-containing protein n=1 Tax=Sphingomonas rustica TaxID=3103142 RepID=A0ABV0B6X2_9SPHN